MFVVNVWWDKCSRSWLLLWWWRLKLTQSSLTDVSTSSSIHDKLRTHANLLQTYKYAVTNRCKIEKYVYYILITFPLENTFALALFYDSRTFFHFYPTQILSGLISVCKLKVGMHQMFAHRKCSAENSRICEMSL